jgi:hypothetical protein
MHDLPLLESEHVIGRLKTIELLEKITRYRELNDPVERRFARALSTVPRAWHTAALLLYSTVVYLPRPLLDETWPCIWRIGQETNAFPTNRGELAFFELDRDQIRDDFYRTNHIPGRLEDNTLIKSSQDIVDTLIANEFGQVNPQVAEQFSFICRKTHWLLLADVTLSGTSILSEMERLTFLLERVFAKFPITISCISQLATNEAKLTITSRGYSFSAALIIPSTYALSSPDCQLFRSDRAQSQVNDLCDWFAETHVKATPDHFISQFARETQNPKILKYGYGGHGWTIVTYKNAPNNSLPLIWFRPSSDQYVPPFERLDSRTRSSNSHRKKWIDDLRNDQARTEELRNKVEGMVT